MQAFRPHTSCRLVDGLILQSSTQSHNRCCTRVMTLLHVLRPDIAAGRISVMVAVLLELLLIPQQTNRLVELLAQRSEWVRSSFNATPSSSHIIVAGAVDTGSDGDTGRSGSVTAFFREYFDEDHGRYVHVLQCC